MKSKKYLYIIFKFAFLGSLGPLLYLVEVTLIDSIFFSYLIHLSTLLWPLKILYLVLPFYVSLLFNMLIYLFFGLFFYCLTEKYLFFFIRALMYFTYVSASVLWYLLLNGYEFELVRIYAIISFVVLTFPFFLIKNKLLEFE